MDDAVHDDVDDDLLEDMIHDVGVESFVEAYGYGSMSSDVETVESSVIKIFEESKS